MGSGRWYSNTNVRRTGGMPCPSSHASIEWKSYVEVELLVPKVLTPITPRDERSCSAMPAIVPARRLGIGCGQCSCRGTCFYRSRIDVFPSVITNSAGLWWCEQSAMDVHSGSLASAGMPEGSDTSSWLGVGCLTQPDSFEDTDKQSLGFYTGPSYL